MTWLELILIAIFVVIGLAIHDVVQRSVEEVSRGEVSGKIEVEDVRLAGTRERLAQIKRERKGIRNRRAAVELARLEDRARREELGPPFLLSPQIDGHASDQVRSLAELDDRLRSRKKLLELLDRRLFELLGEEQTLRQEVQAM